MPLIMAYLNNTKSPPAEANDYVLNYGKVQSSSSVPYVFSSSLSHTIIRSAIRRITHDGFYERIHRESQSTVQSGLF